MKKYIVFIFLLFFVVMAGGCNRENNSSDAKDTLSQPLSIVASFYVPYDFASKIAGFQAQVENLVPPGIEPHEYEPSPREIQKIYEADLFIYHGAGIDSWVDDILPELQQKGISIVNMSKAVDLLVADQNPSHKEMYDPHFWLDPIRAEKQIIVIRDALVTLAPQYRDLFESRADKIFQELQDLHSAYLIGLADCDQKEVITTHKAFQYLSSRYNIDFFSISGFSPEQEPSVRALADLATFAREKNIRYVFFETLFSPKLAETLTTEIGAETLILNPIEGLTKDEQAAGEDYFSLMRTNLENLKIALQCR